MSNMVSKYLLRSAKLFIAALVRLSSGYRPVRAAAAGGAAVVRRRGSARGGHRCHCPRRAAMTAPTATAVAAVAAVAVAAVAAGRRRGGRWWSG